MRGAVGMAFFWLMSMSIMIFVPDLVVYGTLVYKANAVTEQTTKEAEMKGGITSDVKMFYRQVEQDYGMQNKGFTMQYRTDHDVHYREKFSVAYQGTYTFRAFNLLGTGVGKFTLPITAQDTGVSEVWKH